MTSGGSTGSTVTRGKFAPDAVRKRRWSCSNIAALCAAKDASELGIAASTNVRPFVMRRSRATSAMLPFAGTATSCRAASPNRAGGARGSAPVKATVSDSSTSKRRSVAVRLEMTDNLNRSLSSKTVVAAATAGVNHAPVRPMSLISGCSGTSAASRIVSASVAVSG